MRASKEQIKLRDSVFTALDAIYKACEETALRWEKESLPKKTKKDNELLRYVKAEAIPADQFAIIIDKAKWNTSKAKKNKVAIDYIDNYNKMIMLIYASCNTVATSWGTGIPLTLIKNNIEEIKKAFNEGMNKKKEKK